VCSPTYPCGFATVTVRCTCTQGNFLCVDGQGNPMNPGDTPSCGTVGTQPLTCPASEVAAMTASCSQAESGQQCAYPPKCSGGTLAYDRCTCGPTPTGFGYECENSCNSGTGPVPDAGSSSGGDDAAPEAQSGEAGTKGDAASE
jgi:hypothetical protein